MNALDKLKGRAPDLEFELPDGTPVVKLGLIVTLYFKEGYTTESKKNVVECFERFYEEFREELKWQVWHRGKRLTVETFNLSKKQILLTGPNEQYEWHLSSSDDDGDAADYSISAMNSFEVHGDRDRSYIKLILPLSFLSEPDGCARFQSWIEYLCGKVNAEHGYGGPSIVLPYDNLSYGYIETELAQKFLGVEVDSGAFSLGRKLLGCVKGINWYTVLGSVVTERLGGRTFISKRLARVAGVCITDCSHGLIIRASDYPSLACKDEPPPFSYIKINELVRPVRCPDIGAQLCTPGTNFVDSEVTARWVSRFDLEKPDFAPLRRIGAGQPCPRTGDWQPWEQTEIRHGFTADEIMPVYPGTVHGETLWYWSGEEGHDFP